MLYPLAALLTLRIYREENAKANLAREEKKLRQEQERLKPLEEEAERYRLSIPSLVDAEYAKIIGKECTLSDIDAVKSQVAVIDDGLVIRDAKVEQQKVEIERCLESVRKAKEAVVFARKEAAKIEKHKEIWSEIQKKEAERMEDLEMEEFSGIKELD